jgi:hypothetical protein
MSTTMRGRIGSLLLVTGVTILIWIWAAGETRERDRFDTAVRFSPSEAGRMVVRPERVPLVRFEASGSKRALREFETLLAKGPLDLTAGAHGIPSAAGTWPIDLVAAAANLPEVQATGVTVVSSEPKSAEIRIVPLEPRTLRLVPELPGVATQGDVVVDPPTVTALLPSDLRIPADPTAIAFVEPRLLDRLEPGQRISLDAMVRLPAALSIAAETARFEPSTVRVTFTPKVVERTTTLSAVPVQVAGIADDFTSHRIECVPSVLNDVVVSGPAEAIARIESGLRVVAFVHLTTDELEAGVASKPVSLWLLPPGVAVQRVGESSGGQPLVELKISAAAPVPSG